MPSPLSIGSTIGGSITGGTNKSVTSMMSQKFELENKIKLLNSKVNEIKLKEEEINAHDKDVTILERKVFRKFMNKENEH